MEALTILIAGLMGLAWWGIGLVGIIILLAIVFGNEEEASGGEFAAVVVLGLIVYALYTGGMTIGSIVVFSLYYIGIGTVWSIFQYARTIRRIIKRDTDIGHVQDLEYYFNYISTGRTVRWIMYWPMSILNYVIADFIVEIFNKIVDSLGGTFKAITRYYYNKIVG